MSAGSKPYKTREDIENLFERAGIATENVWKAIEVAAHCHRYHRRDDGIGYLEQHIYPITFDVYSYFQGKPELEESLIVALLHDVIEDDCNYTFQRMEKEFGSTVGDCTRKLQKPKKNKQVRFHQDKHDEQVEFIAQLKSAPRVAQVVIILNRLNNIICSEAFRDPAKYARYADDTEELYLPFAQAIDVKLAEQLSRATEKLRRELHTLSK